MMRLLRRLYCIPRNDGGRVLWCNGMLRSTRGFTLFEMVVVVAILAVLSLIAYPYTINTLNSLRVSASAQRVGSDIRYVRDLALAHHNTYGITFNAASNSYTVFELNGATKTTLTDPYTGKSMVVDFDTIPEYSGVNMGSVTMCASPPCGNQELRIDAFGNPMDEGNTALSSQGSVSLQLGGLTRTIQVTPETAFTKVV